MAKKSPIQPDTADTIISRDLRIKGNLSSDNDIWIDGVVEGDVTTQGNISVGESGKILGGVSATEIRVSGTIHGDINAVESTVCDSTAEIDGDIHSPRLSVESGAVISGRIDMGRSETNEEE